MPFDLSHACSANCPAMRFQLQWQSTGHEASVLAQTTQELSATDLAERARNRKGVPQYIQPHVLLCRGICWSSGAADTWLYPTLCCTLTMHVLQAVKLRKCCFPDGKPLRSRWVLEQPFQVASKRCVPLSIFLHMHHNAAESHANRPCPRTYAVLFLNAWDSLQRLKWRQLLCSYAVLQGPVDAPCGEYSQSGHARRLALTVGGKHPRAFAGAAAERAHLLRLSGRRANLVRRQQPHGRCDTLLIHLLFTFCSVNIAYYLCPCGCR